MDLTTKGVTSRLLNVPAPFDTVADPATACPPGAKYIDSANPMASWMLIKMNGMQGACGSAMPLVGAQLTTMQKQCVTDYVMSFAATGGGGAPSGGASAGGSGGASAGSGGK